MLTRIRSCLPRVFGGERVMRGLAAYCFHGVVAEHQDQRLERNLHLLSHFREQMRFMGHRRVVSLVETRDELLQSGGCSVSASVVTFDDGYANNLLAAEILLEAGLPFAIFVSCGAIGTGRAIWTVELSLLILLGELERVEALGQIWPLRTRVEREACFQGVRYPLKRMPAISRVKEMENIRAQFPPMELERLLERFPSLRMLSWQQLRELARAGVEIGSHGVDHELHHAGQDSALRRRELIESKQTIESQVGRPCRFFAFPNGDHCDDSVREVADAGYELAFTTRPGCMGADSNRFLLPRISPGGTVAKLKQQLRRLG